MSSIQTVFFFLTASLSKNNQTLHRTVDEWHKTVASRFTSSLNQQLSDPVSTNTERRHHKPGILWWGCPLETACIQRPTRKDVSPGVESRKVDPWAMEKVMQSNESLPFPFLDRFVLGDLQRIPWHKMSFANCWQIEFHLLCVSKNEEDFLLKYGVRTQSLEFKTCLKHV